MFNGFFCSSTSGHLLRFSTVFQTSLQILHFVFISAPKVVSFPHLNLTITFWCFRFLCRYLVVTELALSGFFHCTLFYLSYFVAFTFEFLYFSLTPFLLRSHLLLTFFLYGLYCVCFFRYFFFLSYHQTVSSLLSFSFQHSFSILPRMFFVVIILIFLLLVLLLYSYEFVYPILMSIRSPWFVVLLSFLSFHPHISELYRIYSGLER